MCVAIKLPLGIVAVQFIQNMFFMVLLVQEMVQQCIILQLVGLYRILG